VRASGSNPGAHTPSDTSRRMSLAVGTSTTSDRAVQSPKDDMGSACLAARTRGERRELRVPDVVTPPGNSSVRGTPTAAPAGTRV